MLDVNFLKKNVAHRAVEIVMDNIRFDDILGIGTGSTVDIFIEQLSKYKDDIKSVVASSIRTYNILNKFNFNVIELDEAHSIPFYIDGADEIDESMNMIKGGGGALTREKIIASASENFICIVDESKFVKILGTFPLPIEIIAMAKKQISNQLNKIGGKANVRPNFVTDNNNIILDVVGLDFDNCRELEIYINNIPGVVTCGLFALQKANQALISTQNGVLVKNSQI
ncbi:Ribose-5-phosphate isomerase A [Candidatus Kinetoplastibacterium sorsogonicusi]|uniref:Ribose-5-phosphate isomerase A n=1 Tax=Candidatus Kinetoplastidibacterium kentomonadis TaxID=1576550 RepID=A0A3S7J9H4_9PROT|nr:ribose-5-phosphate isomerase RpiA [Candidatus Kinetoplastibacterium sorsogonicusi]AWD32316.1 Ribose-5-phosphate isomerase A [Candidatus Kinetoplastibacterium sorsogonicusi]